MFPHHLGRPQGYYDGDEEVFTTTTHRAGASSITAMQCKVIFTGPIIIPAHSTEGLLYLGWVGPLPRTYPISYEDLRFQPTHILQAIQYDILDNHTTWWMGEPTMWSAHVDTIYAAEAISDERNAVATTTIETRIRRTGGSSAHELEASNQRLAPERAPSIQHATRPDADGAQLLHQMASRADANCQREAAGREARAQALPARQSQQQQQMAATQAPAAISSPQATMPMIINLVINTDRPSTEHAASSPSAALDSLGVEHAQPEPRAWCEMHAQSGPYALSGAHAHIWAACSVWTACSVSTACSIWVACPIWTACTVICNVTHIVTPRLVSISAASDPTRRLAHVLQASAHV